MSDNWDDLRDVERQMREEMREEAREVEQLVAESELRSQTLADVGLELINRGDRVQVTTEKRSFTGKMLYAGRDFMTIVDHDAVADIYMMRPCLLQVIERSRGGGAVRGSGPGSFEMRLVEHKTDNAELEVGLALSGESLTVRVVVVGQDHVVMRNRSKEEWIVPFEAIAYVVRRTRTR